MPESPEESSYRHVLLFRITNIGETPPISIETSLYRSELTGNYIIEQNMIALNETTTATVVVDTETISHILKASFMNMTNSKSSSTKFPLGKIVATPASIEAMKNAAQNPRELLARHSRGDWGDLSQEDKDANDASLIDGSRILSSYRLATGEKLWLITEARDDNGNRAATTFLMPEDY